MGFSSWPGHGEHWWWGGRESEKGGDAVRERSGESVEDSADKTGAHARFF